MVILVPQLPHSSSSSYSDHQAECLLVDKDRIAAVAAIRSFNSAYRPTDRLAMARFPVNLSDFFFFFVFQPNELINK